MTEYAILRVKNFESQMAYAQIGVPKNAHLFGAKKTENPEVEITRVTEDGEFFTETVDENLVEVLGYTTGKLGFRPTAAPDNAAKDYIAYVTGG